MNVTIEKSTAYGEISAPPSKSMAHRYIICAALANGESVISNVDFSEDIKATIDCIKTLGADVRVEGSTVYVDGSRSILSAPSETLTFNCRESGSTMRFFMGIAMTLPVVSEFYGSETLRNRPFGIYENILRSDESLSFERQSDKIVIKGGIRENDFEVAGNISSQFITGLLLALSIKGEGGSIKLIPPVESRSYINMTIQAMNEFGINVGWKDENTLYVESGCKYICKKIEVEGDYSNAAFLDAFNLIGGKVKVNGLNEKSLQGDRIYKEYFEKLLCEKATLDIADCPDLGPVLFAMAAANKGGVFTSTARLKIKESDRGSVMCEELAKFGISTHMEENSIEIGCGLNSPTVAVDGHNDHRIVMSMALLLSATGGTINGAQAVRKSYPGFFEDIEKLGIKINKEDKNMEWINKQNVLIVGLGLMGGSYAKALKRIGCRVTAIDKSEETIKFAIENDIIDDGTFKEDISEFVKEADCIILALYPNAAIEWVKNNVKDIKEGIRITDVTGVKSCIVYEIQDILGDRAEFIAAHPMAGKETSGVESADDRIFRDANYIVVPTDKNSEEAILWCENLGQILGFNKVSILSPEEHDEMIAYVSQLTHCIAVSLMTCKDNEHLKDYTGDSFRDLTRIARINENMWSELFHVNKESLLREMDLFIEEITGLRNLIAEDNTEAIKEKMRLSTKRRSKFNTK